MAGPGLALFRDGHGTRSFETRWPEPSTDLGDRCAPTNRYSGAVMAEFWRALRALKALQVDARAYAAVSHLPLPTSGTAGARGQPIEPETRHPGGRRAA